MSEYVIVRINDQLIPEFQIDYNTKTDSAIKSTISSWVDIKQNLGQKLILILSANSVYTTQVNIPSKNEEVIRQSIPFVIEEELANDIDNNHCSYLKLSDQNFLVSVVTIEIIEEIQKSLNANGLNCEEMYSEIFSCPQHDDYLTLCAIEDYFIIREGFKGSIIKASLIGYYLSRADNDKQIVFSDKKIDINDNQNSILKITDTVLLQAQSITNRKGVNLFQGNYSHNIKTKKQSNLWKKPLILLCILVLNWLIINIYQLWKLSTDIDTVKNAQKSLLISLEPNLSPSELNDPYSAMLSRLKINRNTKSDDKNTGFITALTFVGQTLKQHPSINVQSLRHRDSKLEVNLNVTNVSGLNLFQQDLEKNAYSMRIKSGTRDTTKDGIISVITLEQL